MSTIDNDEDDLDDFDPMEFAAALESKSAHPLANAVVAGVFFYGVAWRMLYCLILL